MRKRLLSLLLALALLFSVFPLFPFSSFSEEDPPGENEEPDAGFTDIENHWARESIERAVSMGLFSGTTETTFSPNAPMTRAMFVTVLGKFAGVDASGWHIDYLKYIFGDVNAGSYYAPYLAWAVHGGFTSGTQDRVFSPKTNVTREQIATFLASYLRIEGISLQSEGAYEVAFSDWNSVSGWAKDSVAYLAAAGIFRGSSDGNGGYNFNPKKNATRAECATVFCQLADNILPANASAGEPASITLPCSELEMLVGDFTMLLPEVEMTGSGNRTVIWYSENSSVVRVSLDGEIVAAAAGTARIAAVTSNGLRAFCTVHVSAPPAPPEPDPEPEPGPDPDLPIASGNMTKKEKLIFIYGTSNVSDPRTYYTSESEARSHQTTVTVSVWDLNASGVKYTRTFSFLVHENLAPTVLALFADLYALPEKPVIHSLGGWRWRSYETSEHNMGLAIDVNPAENPYVKKGMDPYEAGFRPGENPYSIPIGGSVDQVFARYGFTRGIYWNNGNKDYMHYSFFGT